MFKLRRYLGFNVCCVKRFLKKRGETIVTIINIGILYYFGLHIYNYSFNISYNCTNALLYMDEAQLTTAIFELMWLLLYLFCICSWVALSQVMCDALKCNCYTKCKKCNCHKKVYVK
jgi:hypothetical protein